MNEYNKQTMIEIVKLILAEPIPLRSIENCRKLISFVSKYDVSKLKENNDFKIIEAVEANTDEFPVGEMRQLCNKDYLKKMDEELERYFLTIKPELLKACQNIIELYQKELKSAVLDKATVLRDNWFQCLKCNDAWKELSVLVIIQCPSCRTNFYNPNYVKC